MKQNTAQHTPGPWASCPGQAKQRYRIETKGTGNDCEPIAECKGPDREANARLIATAPELLEALQLLYSSCERESGFYQSTTAIKARAAIAAATQP